jgi:hypothetical protein
MSGLVRYEHEIAAGVRVLECVQCREKYPADEAIDLGTPLTCVCGGVGFIPRRIARIAERFPEEIAGKFTPLPDALQDHAKALGLSGRELLTVWALERHRRAMGDRVFPSVVLLAKLTQQSERTVKRGLQVLNEKGYVRTERYRWIATGRRASNRYDLDGLWRKVAELEAEDQVASLPRVA